MAVYTNDLRNEGYTFICCAHSRDSIKQVFTDWSLWLCVWVCGACLPTCFCVMLNQATELVFCCHGNLQSLRPKCGARQTLHHSEDRCTVVYHLQARWWWSNNHGQNITFLQCRAHAELIWHMSTWKHSKSGISRAETWNRDTHPVPKPVPWVIKCILILGATLIRCYKQ